MIQNDTLLEERAKLAGSLLLFTTTFYPFVTGREFKLSHPVSQESHFITICRALMRVFHGEINRLAIDCPPGWAKSELVKNFVAWAMAQYPDSQFLYISAGADLAAKHTYEIRKIISHPYYRRLFDVHLTKDVNARDHFVTTAGGVVAAFGSGGMITGRNAGLPQMDRFSGALVIDDIHKPDEVYSELTRVNVIRNFSETLERRLRGPNVPIVYIGHRLHEEDFSGWIKENEPDKWTFLKLEAHDQHLNARYPEKDTIESLMEMKKTKPYVYWSQYMQNPQAPGAALFKEEWFKLLDWEPDMLATFLTIDTAETDKTYNDATVFSFWGIYRIKHDNAETDLYGLHWLDCWEIRVEPKDLREEFFAFYADCMRYKVKPYLVAIEKKSTGVTLSSILSEYQGLRIVDVERTRASKNKVARYQEAQEYVASKRVSLPRLGKHTLMCLNHCKKITANMSHSHDDIADTMYDAIKIALIDKMIMTQDMMSTDTKQVMNKIQLSQQKIKRLRTNASW